MNIAEWNKYERDRQTRISDNRSRLMRGETSLPKIPKIPKPIRVQLFTPEDDYIGTWGYGVSQEIAIKEAIEHGEKVGKVKYV